MSLIIWMDQDETKIFQLLSEGVRKLTIRKSGYRHPIETLGKNHPIKQTDEERFYHYVCEFLEKMPDSNWFLCGPGLARQHFLNHIKQHHAQLEKKVKTSQKLDYLTDAQIVDHGIKYFKHAHIFSELEYAASPEVTNMSARNE